MIIYTKTNSEQGKEQGKGGNKFINVDIFINDRDNPRYNLYIQPEHIRLQDLETLEFLYAGKIKIKNINPCLTNHATVNSKGICLNCGLNTLHLTNKELKA